MPSGPEKRALYEFGRTELLKHNFKEIGMDHFAKPDDELFIAEANGLLHRNFMGYTTTTSKFILGLGVSSISDTWGGFMQNIKEVEAYQEKLDLGEFPISKGHILTPKDKKIRMHILNLMCKHQAELTDYSPASLEIVTGRLSELQSDGLVEINGNVIEITDQGKPFLRNIAICLDERYWEVVPQENLFSKSV